MQYNINIIYQDPLLNCHSESYEIAGNSREIVEDKRPEDTDSDDMQGDSNYEYISLNV